MRLRHKPWARPELEECPFNIENPIQYRGKWNGQFLEQKPLRIELGCGKGGFMAQICRREPEYNYLAVDIKSEVLVLAKRAIEAAYEGQSVTNVLLMAQNIEQIDQMLSPEDKIDRIYINFCNPWPKMKHKKRRLTHPRQLIKYREFLKKGGEIWFKTDDDPLFEESIEYFQSCGFEIKTITRSLHHSGITGSYATEHERMFSEQGIPIKFLIAVKGELSVGEGSEKLEAL